MSAAFATIPANLADALGSWTDPLRIEVGDVSDQAAVAEKQKVSEGTFGAMASRFDGSAGAFAYLLFILLYMPCTAAIAAVYQESGSRWTIFVTLWTTGLAFGLATLYYQIARWDQHPTSSAVWVGGLVAAFIVTLLAMRRAGRQTGRELPLPQRA